MRLIEAEFLAVSQTRVAYFNAATTAAANPGDAAAQAAAAAALAAFNDATAALDAVRGPLDALLAANGIVLEGDNIQITNVAPDEGLSAPFNSWFTLFGQFFDHGLDLVAKGGAGTVFIPLMPDDPLYVPGGTTNFMVLTRATLGRERRRPINTTTSFVDQNQTYASHASHQVFLREYEFNGAGDPVNTGKLIEGTNSGMATWADLKAQASELPGHPAPRPGRRQRPAAGDRRVRQLHSRRERLPAGGLPGRDAQSIRRVLVEGQSGRQRRAGHLDRTRDPDRPRLPGRHRAHCGARTALRTATSRSVSKTAACRPTASMTTNCSTPTSWPVTAG